MKKTILSGLLLLCCLVNYGQEFRVSSTGSVVVKGSSYLYVNDLNVDSGGSLVVQSDATNSASLLVNGTATGDITYERHLASTNWYIVSSPVTTQDVDDFVTANTSVLSTSGTVPTRRAVGYFDTDGTAGSRWTYYDSSSNPTPLQGNFNSGEGYIVNRTAAGTLSFTGNVVTTDVNSPITSSNGDSYYWQSVGNPFPSFLPANDNANATNVLSQNSSKLDPSFALLYFWNGSGYTPVAADDPEQYIAPGQGFMILPKDGVQADFVFTKSLTTHPSSGTTTFFRNSSEQRIQLELKLTEGSNETTTTLRFRGASTKGLDPGYDAGAFRDGTPAFSIDTHLIENSQGIDFTIQSLPQEYEDMVVPLSVYADAGKTIAFSLAKQNFPENINVFIEDKELNTNQLLNENETYQVTLNSSLSGIGRFYIHTTANSVLSTDDEILLNNVHIFSSNRSTLTITGINAGEKTKVELYSVLGKQVFSKQFQATSRDDINLPGLSAGIYVARVAIENKGVISKKIVIQ